MRASATKTSLLALLVHGTSVSAMPPDMPSPEYNAKASFLRNVLQFIDWPTDVFDDSQFTFCVVDTARFGSALDAIAADRVKGQKIVVLPLQHSAEVGTKRCHLLFIAHDKPATGVTAARGLLIVGDGADILERGGAIRLIERDGHIRFQINVKAARAAGLSLSSRLLDLALPNEAGDGSGGPAMPGASLAP
jgi:hypothetical protein